MTGMFDEETELMERVTQLINERDAGAAAELFDSGGGIYGIAMPAADGQQLFFGTADVTWGGKLTDAEGEHLRGVETDCPSDETDPAKIADALVSAARPLMSAV